MKINVVLPHQLPFPPVRGGGVENLNWILVREFARRGYQVVAYSRTANGGESRVTDEHGIEHVRVQGYDRHPNRWIDHANALRYARNLQSVLEDADITSFHTPFSFLLRRKRGLGVCTHTIHRTPKWPVPFYRGLDRVYCGSDAVVAQARRIDPKMANLKRIYNCITIPDSEPEVARSKAEGEGLLFLYVGRFVPDKGLASLVYGFEKALEQFPRNRLRTVGPLEDADGGDSRFFRKISRDVQSRGLDNRVQFLPPVFDKTRLNALIEEADVICVPSLSGETFSMAILEAMALAKPVLVSDFSPMPEAVDRNITGYVARAGDAESIAEGIRFFSANAERLPAMGRAGFEKVRRCFSVQQIAGEYLEDFERLIQRARSRSIGPVLQAERRY